MILSEEDRQLVKNWGLLWDLQYTNSINIENPEFDITPWISSYTGIPIPEEEMQEWVNASISRIRSLLPKGGNVLEIGCGTGLMLYRLLDLPAEFVGIDISEQALNIIRNHLSKNNVTHISLLKKSAIEISDLQENSFDLVFLNSVSQYFPGQDYMKAVLTSAVKLLKPKGSIYLGDVRNSHSKNALHQWAKFQQSDKNVPIGTFKLAAEKKSKTDRELSYDPDFFMDFAKEHKISALVQLRRGRRHNEMTSFRYDVILSREINSRIPLYELHKIPNARVSIASRLSDLLKKLPEGSKLGDVNSALVESGGMEPEDFWELAEKLNFDIEIGFDSWDFFKARFFQK